MADSHQQFTDEEFEQLFADCTFPPKLFNHEAHIRLGFIHLKKYPKDQAIENVCKQILKFDQVHDKGDKYDHQLTIAAMEVIHELIEKSQPDSFEMFLSSNQDIMSDFKSLIQEKLLKQE